MADTANTEWWKQFGDPVLDGLIADALANNKNVRIAAANVEQAAGAFVTTRSPLFPQFGYGGEGRRDRFSNDTANPLSSGTTNPQTNYQAGATASWEIDLWGRLRRQTESAQANLLATEEARRGVLLTLVSSVATGYLQLRALDEQLVIAERTLAAYADSLKLFELQFSMASSQMTVAQAQSQYESAGARFPRYSSRSWRRRTRCACCSAATRGPSRGAGRSTRSSCPRCRREYRPICWIDGRTSAARSSC